MTLNGLGKNHFKWVAVAAAAQLLGLASAHAAGFEKTVLWGAEQAGTAGIGVPNTKGADGLFFNPATIVGGKPGSQLSFNITPTWATFSGPINFNNDSATSSNALTTPLSLIYAGTLNDQWAFAVGGYVAGGAKAEYTGVPMANTAAGQGVDSNNLGLYEFSAGVAYKMNDQWSFGAAYRVIMASAEFSLIEPIAQTPAGFLDLQVLGAKGSSYLGYRLGTEYKMSDKTKIGVTYRSENSLSLNGNYGGTYSSPSPFTTFGVDSTNATIRTVLPMSASAGIEHDYEHWKALAQVDWTQYSRVGEINVDGIASVANGAKSLNTAAGGFHVQEHWQDMYVARLGGEYSGWSWPVRFGYAWTSAVADAAYAQPAFAPPAAMHTFTVGSGQTWDIMGHPLAFNVAGEYDFSSGSGTGANAGTIDPSLSSTRPGTYSVTSYAVHLGVAYAF